MRPVRSAADAGSVVLRAEGRALTQTCYIYDTKPNCDCILKSLLISYLYLNKH